MKKISLFILFILICFFGKTQSIELYDLNAGNIEIESNNLFVSYTIGGSFVKSLQSQNNIVTQGIQQPLKSGLVTGTPFNFSNEKIEISAYPNPATNEVYVVLKNLKEALTAYIEVKNISGKSITMPYVQYILWNQQAIRLELSNLQPGYYIVSIVSQDNYERIGFFKLIKIK